MLNGYLYDLALGFGQNCTEGNMCSEYSLTHALTDSLTHSQPHNCHSHTFFTSLNPSIFACSLTHLPTYLSRSHSLANLLDRCLNPSWVKLSKLTHTLFNLAQYAPLFLANLTHPLPYLPTSLTHPLTNWVIQSLTHWLCLHWKSPAWLSWPWGIDGMHICLSFPWNINVWNGPGVHLVFISWASWDWFPGRVNTGVAPNIRCVACMCATTPASSVCYVCQIASRLYMWFLGFSLLVHPGTQMEQTLISAVRHTCPQS